MFKPQVILEIGAGLSTLVLSKAQEALKDEGVENTKFVSIEQSQEHMDLVLGWADKAKVKNLITPVVLPMTHYQIGPDFALDERAMPCIDFDETAIHDACGGVRPDLIIVDGPVDEKSLAGISFTKTLTVPILSLYASDNAAYIVNGVYQDPEIFAMEQWQQSGAAAVVGVKAVGQGMMIGLAPVKASGEA